MRIHACICVLGLLGCNRLLHHDAPDASALPSASASADAGAVDEEEEAVVVDAGGVCPIAIHPGYCRNNCRSYDARVRSKHARRVAHSARVGLGTCGALRVFAEDEQPGDGGVQEGVVEFFDEKGLLVGAIDTRSKPCGQFGNVPSCTPVVAWEESHDIVVRSGEVATSGKQLPVEVIQRIVRQNFGRFRLCAMNGKGAARTGRVVTKFVIAKDGSVSSAKDDGSDFADRDVVTCVVRAFSNLSFPEPTGGPMTVTFPIVFGR